MPIYEYQCKACGHVFSQLQKMSDAPLADCPVCHKAELQKLVSASSFQLKGSGWYATDFKSKPASVATKTDTPATNDTTAAPAATETKTTATAATETKTDKSQ
jgi:putative FmdB family regulatory protein